MMRFDRISAACVAWVVVQTPAVALACAVCTAGKDEENAFAFLMTTIFMSIMPLAAVGTLGFVLWRRFKKLEAEQGEAAREHAATAHDTRGVAAPDPGSALPRTS